MTRAPTPVLGVVVATADAVTGVPCLIGASYAQANPQPGELYLYGPRKDLVSSR